MSSAAKLPARREAVITALLVIAGLVLAICIFAAGLLWRGRPETKPAPIKSSEVQGVPLPEKG